MLQLEQAAIAQLQSETIASEVDTAEDEDDPEQRSRDFSDLQVVLYNSADLLDEKITTFSSCMPRMRLHGDCLCSMQFDCWVPLQVLLHSSEDFGPVTIRDLTVCRLSQFPPVPVFSACCAYEFLE